MTAGMTLKVLLPFEVLADFAGVERVVVETPQGCWGLLPQRLDCVAPVVPGILSVKIADHAEVFFAVDEGVLIKTGADVMVSVRRAIRGADLAQLHQAVVREFLTLDEGARALRAATHRIETGFLRRFAALREYHP
jgi:F-type H+-transporting ATPase subunit epsilon